MEVKGQRLWLLAKKVKIQKIKETQKTHWASSRADRAASSGLRGLVAFDNWENFGDSSGAEVLRPNDRRPWAMSYGWLEALMSG